MFFLPDINSIGYYIAMLDNKNQDTITINEEIENNLGSAITRTEIQSTVNTVIITIVVLIILGYIAYKLNRYYKSYVLKHINRTENV